MSRETLRQKQSRFARAVALLIPYAEALGYEVTLGEAWRPRERAVANARAGIGIADSLHCDRLAIDLNLFKNGKYLRSSNAHRPLGEFWESLGDDYHWGGHFGDGNHYSVGFRGRK